MKSIFTALFGSKPASHSTRPKRNISVMKPVQEEDVALPKEEPYSPPPSFTATINPKGNSLTDWQDILEGSDPESAEYQEAFDKALEKADSLDDYAWLFDETSNDKKLSSLVLERLKNFKVKFDEYSDVYSERSQIDPFTDVLVQKMLEFASSTDDWVNLIDLTSNECDDDHKTVLAALKNLEWPKEEWKKLLDNTNDDETEVTALLKLLQFCQTAVDVLEFHHGYIEDYEVDSKVEEKIFEKLFTLTTRQEAKIIFLLTEDADLSNAAENFLKA